MPLFRLQILRRDNHKVAMATARERRLLGRRGDVVGAKEVTATDPGYFGLVAEGDKVPVDKRTGKPIANHKQVFRYITVEMEREEVEALLEEETEMVNERIGDELVEIPRVLRVRRRRIDIDALKANLSPKELEQYNKKNYGAAGFGRRLDLKGALGKAKLVEQVWDRKSRTKGSEGLRRKRR